MRRAIRWTLWTIATLLGLLLLIVMLVLVAVNTRPGRDLIERLAPRVTGGTVTLAGLAGRFPDALRIARIEVRDEAGLWLAIDNLRLDWSPSRLLVGVVAVDRLEAGRIAVDRLPIPASQAPPEPSPPGLPVGVTVRALHVKRLDLASPVAGTTAVLAIDGAAHLASFDQGDIDLSVRRLDAEGTYDLQGRINPATLQAHLSAQEPAHGLLSAIAGLPDLGALSVDASMDGPRSAVHTKLALAAGALHAAVQGTLDLEHDAADLVMTASAPEMKPRPDLSWQALALDAHIQGPFTQPTAKGVLRIDALSAAGAAISRIAVDLQSSASEAHLRAELDGLRIPGPRPDVLAATPLILQANARLDAPDRPVILTLKHPLIAAEGRAATAGDLHGELALALPDLSPLAAVGGVDLRGNTALTFRAAKLGDTTRLEIDGKLAVTGGMAPMPALIGEAAKIDAAIALRGSDITLSRLRFDAKALTLSAGGTAAEDVVDLNWKLALSDLGAITPTLSGRLSAEGRLTGAQNDLALTTDLKGEVATQGMPRGPIAAELRLQGLPRAPAGQLTAQGVLIRSPLQLAIKLQRNAQGALQVTIDRADWKSVHAKGALSLPKGTPLPVGNIELRMRRLEDLRPLLGQLLTGSLIATLKTTERASRLRLDARNVGLAGTASVERVVLAATVADPTTHPMVNGQLTLADISAGATTGTARLELKGPEAALALDLAATLQNLAGAETQMSSTGVLNLQAKHLALSALQVMWKGETLRLLAPVRIGFADGITLDRLRLGLRQAVLEIAGRATPTLDLSLALRKLPADLATLFVSGLAMDGTLQADARLTGTPARPGGTVAVAAKGLHLRTGPGRALPPANLIATTALTGETAHIDTRLTAGPTTTLTVNGQAPITPSGPLDLRAQGRMNLKLLDPLLAAAGRSVRGQITLNAGLVGTIPSPRITGTVQLADGEVQDYALGAHLTGITALLQAEGETLRLTRFEGQAGPGTIMASGTVGVRAPGVPIDLSVTARKARPLSSDRLTVDLNADVTVRGRAMEQLAAAGTLHINRADIRIPEHLPATIAVLDVRKPGAPPPPPPEPGPDIVLSLTIDAPRAIFVRGRGLDAELGGTVRVRGTAANPEPEGNFKMRRGQFSLAGRTLVFSKGVVGFTGGGLTDPSLNFVADTTSGNVTATLAVGGTARKPKITLSSVPDLPQDEVLAQLLFGHGTASLSPFELVQIASAVAALTGVTSGGRDPLETVRKGLGLDRLSIGGGQGDSPTLEAGRYVAPGVYVGTKQGISATSTQATVQIDITRGLKLESNVGIGGASTGAASRSDLGTNSVGVIYQFEY
jgi:translocation and assembly module TamB